MLKPEIIELITLLVFGPAIGVFLCLRTGTADWATQVASQPFEFIDRMASEQPDITVFPSTRLEAEA